MTKLYDSVQGREFQGLDRDPARSFTLPGFYYSRPDIFAEEAERIFYKTWQLVGHESELKQAGDYACAEIVDQRIFVIRGKDDVIRGFYNVCQHRAHELLQGRGKVKAAIVCPYHAWAYETDGSLRAARHADRLPNFDKNCFGLKPVRVETAMGFVFVNLDPDAPTLDSLAGEMFADMRRELPWWDQVAVSEDSSSGSWDGSILKANWKTLAENCLECYHCAPAHPALVDLVDMRSYHCAVNGAWLKSFGKLNKPDNRAYAVDPSEPSQTAVFWHLWPNVEFGVLPGEASIGAFRFYPRGPEETCMTGTILTRPGETIRSERRNYRWNVLWPEDEALCESVNRGLKSRGYSQGRFIVDPERGDISEHAVHAFQTRYAEMMGL